MSDDRKEWFKSQIGKTIWRNKTTCDCAVCESAYTNGLRLFDLNHAMYVYTVESDVNFEGGTLKYFETKEERDEFEKINK